MTRLVLVAMLALVAAHVVNADEDSHSVCRTADSFLTAHAMVAQRNATGPLKDRDDAASVWLLRSTRQERRSLFGSTKWDPITILKKHTRTTHCRFAPRKVIVATRASLLGNRVVASA